jgi:UDP-N-acetylmuramate: L-alanyl-gamma-D-glutamyl-meso-diaminopimelate ligase
MKIHFIAIGGAIMHNLALALLEQGHTVTGSDDEIFDPSKSRLDQKGLLPPEFGWFPEKVNSDLDMVILGMHAKADNPELLKAQELGLAIHSFPSFTYEHAKSKKRVVVAGSHGKTTTTAMILHILKTLGKSFDYLVGSQIDGFDLMVGLSDAPIMVIEGDEYLTSPLDRRPKFLWYKPDISIITGIAWDHINVFPTFDNYVEQFQDFVNSHPAGAYIIPYELDEELSKLTYPEGIEKKPYKGFQQATEGNQVFALVKGKKYPIQVFGAHNLANMEAAIQACAALDISVEDAMDAMTSFTGTARRMETIYQDKGIRIIRDFAHSPSKVKATVAAVKNTFPKSKVVAMLELHTYSSLNPKFLPEYTGSLNKADHALVYYDEHVFQIKKLPVLEKQRVQEAFSGAYIVHEKKEVVHFFQKHMGPGTIYLIMSSGSFSGIDWMELCS